MSKTPIIPTTAPVNKPATSGTLDAIAKAVAAQKAEQPPEEQVQAPEVPPSQEQEQIDTPAKTTCLGADLQVGDQVRLAGGNVYQVTQAGLSIVQGRSLQRTINIQPEQVYQLVAGVAVQQASTVIKGAASTASLKAQDKEPAARAAQPESPKAGGK